jgi:hypothetical protein
MACITGFAFELGLENTELLTRGGVGVFAVLGTTKGDLPNGESSWTGVDFPGLGATPG